MHPGGDTPITRVAEVDGATALAYPPLHGMHRWRSNAPRHLSLLGRLGDEIDFVQLPSSVQTVEMANHVGALAAGGTAGFEACGSPGEVANEPHLGHQWGIYYSEDASDLVEQPRRQVFNLTSDYSFRDAKSNVWLNVVFSAPDQLRQRVAWALAQIVVCAENGVGKAMENEVWHNFYDIFVRHAFGNYRDVLREASWSPMMAIYLSYRRNKAWGFAGTYPDENYAREVMQLFTIGLEMIHLNGTRVTSPADATNAPIATYDNDDIIDFARVWTGFDERPSRSNIEHAAGDSNDVDPMLLRPAWRDVFPKMTLFDGYLGDGYPLCSSRPARPFLRAGAAYEYVGTSDPTPAASATDVRLELQPASSGASTGLYDALCEREAFRCRFRSTVTLGAALPCPSGSTARECAVDVLTYVKLVDGDTTAFYAYVAPPCVGLAFFNDGAKVTEPTGADKISCVEPTAPLGGVACCDSASSPRASDARCEYAAERTTLATAVARCAQASQTLCDYSRFETSQACAYGGVEGWTNVPCYTRAQIDSRGFVSIVHSPTSDARFQLNSRNWFRVRWADGRYPTKELQSCGAACSVSGSTCLCDVHVNSTAGFSAADVTAGAMPTRARVEEVLRVGSTPPHHYDAGVYVPCTGCGRSDDVAVHVLASRGVVDERAIFQIRVNGSDAYFVNVVSTVHVSGDATYRFRNPPFFNSFVSSAQTSRDAAHEVEALLDHLFWHPNTAPFIAIRLIQRLVTSNPSPRYVAAVATAFTTGVAPTRPFSRRYGDLGAAVFAILTDREARAAVLDSDPAHGAIREPLLKLTHFLRAMEYAPRDGKPIDMRSLATRIGMQAHESPSVFNFYLPEYVPAGRAASAGLVSPEAELGTAPYLLGFFNGMLSLIKNGLSSCEGGFGTSDGIGCRSNRAHEASQGDLAFAPAVPTAAASVVDELALLLTAGRLDPHVRGVIVGAYNQTRAALGAAAALQRAQRLFLFSSEFHATNINALDASARQQPAAQTYHRKPYKAIVVFYLEGGADSFNMLVPHSGCTPNSGGGGDLAAQYETERGPAKLDRSSLLQIDAPPCGDMCTQPCSKFGLHPRLDYLQSLYNRGDAAFVANIGQLIQPVTKDEFKVGSKPVPASLFAHNFARQGSHTLDPQLAPAKGVLGRMNEALSAAPSRYTVASYSLDGHKRILEGDVPADILDATEGVVKLHSALADDQTKADLASVTSRRSSSVFGDTYGGLLQSALRFSDHVGGVLDQVEPQIVQSFPDTQMGKKLRQVAKLVRAHEQLETERATFFVGLGGFDAHKDLGTTLDANLDHVDNALAAFVEELRNASLLDSVAIFSQSDFARTLTSNGQGTDHGWGGNHFLIGGGVDGGRIFGEFPSDLTDDSPINVGRGRFIPQLGWEGVWHGLAQWFGVEGDVDMDYVLPNRRNFAPRQLLGESTLFKRDASRRVRQLRARAPKPTAQRSAPTPTLAASPGGGGAVVTSEARRRLNGAASATAVTLLPERSGFTARLATGVCFSDSATEAFPATAAAAPFTGTWRPHEPMGGLISRLEIGVTAAAPRTLELAVRLAGGAAVSPIAGDELSGFSVTVCYAPSPPPSPQPSPPTGRGG
mmetsp:Transcript_34397/g.94802  ORF Transcript_34397/g.94802 Transcript_34397/m.94802 type:complete len:1606 (+) Transcript_34397:291-5108(+)